MKLKAFCFIAVLAFAGSAFSQRPHPSRPTDSGGPLSYEQAAFDVRAYDITAEINPASRSLKGTTIIEAMIVAPTRLITIDLDTPYEVSSVKVWKHDAFAPANFLREDGKIKIEFEASKQPGEKVDISISYSGKPRVAPNPPWVGGFMWEKTADGSDWITVACQNDGADLWFPVKDHPSDEADSVNLHITVPEDLYVASVGKLQKVTQNKDKTKTFDWFMSNSINNYNIVVNIAPYKLVEASYKSTGGETFPIIFYALPESAEKAKDIVAQTKKFLAFYEKYAGPYPYRSEKLGIAETPHLGMEHSTIIAYGNKFKNGPNGFDTLMLHELGHEWWGNLVTASDWRDMWIHEGFQSYFDALYVEDTLGRDAYLKAMSGKMKATNNLQPVAPRESRFTYQIYFQAPDYLKSDGDIYGKGASILHTLRYLIGDDAFFRSVRKMAYPEKEMEGITSGKQSRLVTTDDFKQIAENESGINLDWFFEVYFRQPKLPELDVSRSSDKMELQWKTPNDLPFPMAIDVEINGVKKRIAMPDGNVSLTVKETDTVKFDPEGWILKTSGS